MMKHRDAGGCEDRIDMFLACLGGVSETEILMPEQGHRLQPDMAHVPHELTTIYFVDETADIMIGQFTIQADV